MPGPDARFSEEELDAALRKRAEAEGRSMRSFAHDAVIRAVRDQGRQ
ncbi:hypothetical protein [Streptomyces formicae]|nr:hypothetical protein [Streptomyces formicae]